MQSETEPRHLHRDGRSAAGDAVKPRKIDNRTRERDWVDPRMPRIKFVFIPQGRVDQLRRNLRERRPDPEFLIGAQRHAQQFSISIADNLGKRNAVEQQRLRQREPRQRRRGQDRERARQSRSPHARAPRQRRRGRERERAETAIAAPISLHWVTTILPPIPRPLTLRSYIDCAKTGGTTYWPRLHDLIS